MEFYWAPFLVESNSDDPQVHSIMDRVIAWRAIAKHAKNWKGVDYLVFNSYIWWLNTFEMKVMYVSHDDYYYYLALLLGLSILCSVACLLRRDEIVM